jgi:hypothetical protein
MDGSAGWCGIGIELQFIFGQETDGAQGIGEYFFYLGESVDFGLGGYGDTAGIGDEGIFLRGS